MSKRYKPTEAQKARLQDIATELFGKVCCHVCGSVDSLEVDHVKPWSKNQKWQAVNKDINLQLLCHTCNNAKSDTEPNWNYQTHGIGTMSELRTQFAVACTIAKSGELQTLVETMLANGKRKPTIRRRLERLRVGERRIRQLLS